MTVKLAKKIRGLSTAKTPEYIAREWATFTAKKTHLLLTTDWTQMVDSNLTFESSVLWRLWRSNVRNVGESSGVSLDEAQKAIDALDVSRPPTTKVPDPSITHVKYKLDARNLDAAVRDARTILKQHHESWLLDMLPESKTLIELKLEEVRRFIASGDEHIGPEYPLLSTMMELTGDDVYTVTEKCMDMSRLLTELLISLERHRYKFTKELDDAQTVTTVINVVNRMHGY